jgi:hypothetical protein
MAAESNNKYDELLWIKKVIDSTTTYRQFNNADKLIELFDKKYDDFDLYQELSHHAIDHLGNIEN